MKKSSAGEMRQEYDFKAGIRGKHTTRYPTPAAMDEFIESVIKNSKETSGNASLFDIGLLKTGISTHNRYERRLAQLQESHRFVDNIKETVDEAIANTKDGSRSFVIYGEPQSGKTEMMIALTARLLDEGHRIIIVLINDNVTLLDQNLSRFRSAGLDPSPKKHDEILHQEIALTSGEWIIFSKKNHNDLAKLIEKLRKVRDPVVVIDDEADYATPNARINKPDEQTRINELVETILGDAGLYIGVTATPARLNLNHTFENETERWVLFKPHPDYKGRTVFFPTNLEALKHLPFALKKLPEDHSGPRFLRDALFSFLINVGHLNTAINPHEQNYSMLIHTSGAKDDHSEDYKQVLKLFTALATDSHPSFETYYRQIWKEASERYPGEETTISQYIMHNSRRHDEVVMNSDRKQSKADWERATSPQAPFTIVIGGNIVSRGVTFNNLLSMFFTRDVKHKIQQDTYIQRARMFGDRGLYLNCFELSIPASLYQKWHRCFLFHDLALLAINTEHKSPVWIEDKRIAAVAASSIDRATVNIASGEMSWALFKFDRAAVDAILRRESTPTAKLLELHGLIGEAALPGYLLNFIGQYMPHGEESIAVHDPYSIDKYNDVLKEMSRELVYRRRGFMGSSELELGKYPKAEHHIRIFYFLDGARVFYKFNEDVAFLRQG
jgi:archaellum biogenesis ATPase FlaH